MLSTKERTIQWIEGFVLKHNLCPFAKIPFTNNKILYQDTNTTQLEKLLFELHTLLFNMEGYSNGFFILPSMEFDEFLDVFYAAEQYIIDAGFSSEFQLASFHPEYQFADYSEEDKRNRTNQSPFPMIHILRVLEMKKAIEQYGDTTQIFVENEKKMNRLE